LIWSTLAPPGACARHGAIQRSLPRTAAPERFLALNRNITAHRVIPFGWTAASLAVLLGVGALIGVIILRLVVPLPDKPVAMPLQGPTEIREDRIANLAVPLPSSYAVEEGDTLFAIAAELDSSVDALVLANNLADLDLLRVGQVLLVPQPGSARQPTDPSQSLAEVAASYSLDARVLAAYNGIAAALIDQPIAREALLFPPGVIPLGLASAASTSDETLLTAIPFGAERSSEPFVYRVRPGDTLTDVAWRLGIDVDTILNNNSDMGDGDQIQIGDELLILPMSGLLYQVQAGDTVSEIAERFGVDVDPILELNALETADMIALGMELLLPGAGPVVYEAPLPFAAAQPGIARIGVPYRSQLDGMPWAGANCGPVSLAMGLESLGIKMSSTELRRQVLNSQGIWGNNVGTLMDSLAKVASSNGARPIGLYDGNRLAKWSVQDVREQLRAGRPVIVQVRFRALPGRAGVAYYNDHYIILTGLSGEGFLYNDPLDSDGPGANRLMSAPQLDAAMNATDQRYAHAAFALAR
jgi:LysM repeat protein/uncharacterized protein YvpB